MSKVPNLSQLAGKMVMMLLLVLLALQSITGCEKTVESIYEETVPFSTEYKKDSCLKPGEEIVEQEGKNGLAEIKIEKRFKGEKIISEREVSRVVIKEAVPKIVRRGEEKNIEFSGYKWLVKSGRGLGPGPNIWCSDNVEVDAKGHLHLKMTNMGTHNPSLDEWHCSEVRSENSFGYGEYRWSVKSGLSNLHPNVTLGLFTYLDDSHEIDFEFGRWGKSTTKNGQFVVQPAADDSVHRFKLLEEAIAEFGFTIGFVWRPDSIVFRCWLGEVLEPGVRALLISEWRYNGRKIPKAGNERVHMNLWLVGGSQAGPKEKTEVVLGGFGFTPLAQFKSTPVIRMWGEPSITVWVEADDRTVRGYVEGLTPDKVEDYEVRIYAITDRAYIQPYIGSTHRINPRTMHFKTWTRLWYKLRADLIRKSTGEVIARDYYK